MKQKHAIPEILVLLLASSVVLSFKNIIFLTVAFVLTLTAVLLGKSRNKVFKRIKSFVPAAILIFTLQFVFNSGVAILETLTFSYMVISKLLTISLMVLLFVSSVSPGRIVSSFFFLSQNMKIMLTMTFYFIPLIFDEAKIITTVQKSRGHKTNGFNIAPLIVPLIHRVFLRAQALSLSLVSRGQ